MVTRTRLRSPSIRSVTRPLVAFALVLLLLAPGPADAQGGGSVRAFAVRSVDADEGNVTFHVQTVDAPLFLEFATLARDGVPVADDVTIGRWTHRDTMRVVFQPRENLTTATLTLYYHAGGGARGADVIPVVIPGAGADAPSPADVDVVDATLDGDGVVTLTLRNAGNRAIRDARVAVEDLQGVRVAAPFVQDVPEVPSGGVAHVTVTLARDVRDVSVRIEMGEEAHATAVRVRDADGPRGAARLTLDTDFPARETEPGGAPAYTLHLGNGGPERFVTLRARGLPDGFGTTFTVDGSRATSFRVPDGGARSVVLGIATPASATDLVGSAIPFTVDALVDGEVVTHVNLTLTLRGEGRLEVTGENWFTEASPGGDARVDVTVRNTGSAALFDVTPLVNAPAGWRVDATPRTLPRLNAGDDAVVTLSVTAPGDVAPGRYLLDVAAATGDVEARARSLSVSVTAATGSSLPWIAAAVLGGLVVIGVMVKVKRT